MFLRYLTVFFCATATTFANNEINSDIVRARAEVAYETLETAKNDQDRQVSEIAEIQGTLADSSSLSESAKTNHADSTDLKTTAETDVEDSVETFEAEEAVADSLESEQLAKSEDQDTEPNGEEIPENGENDTEENEEQLAIADSSTVDSTTADSVLASSLDFSNGALPTVNPVRITSPYGIRHYRLHRGVDVKVFKGDSIVAAFPGKVIASQYERRGYGHYLKVKHENGTITVYGHLSKRLKKVGEEVEAGELIGLGGNTGRSTGSHLHFEIRYGQINIDPTTVFNFVDGGLQQNVETFDVQTASASHDEIQKELAKHRIYKVRRGDTLGSIARKYGTSVRRIKQLNGLRSDRIRAGQILRCS